LIKTILFDLDNTLSHIRNGGAWFREIFLHKYAETVSSGTGVSVDTIKIVVMKIVKDFKENPPITKTISDIFFKAISQHLKVDIERIMELTHEFYTKKMLELKEFYEPAPKLHEVLNNLRDMNLKIAIATDPVTKTIGVMQRLKWINLDNFPFCFISSADTMHAAKPHKAFYKEILKNCNSKPEESMMVGDTYLEDIFAAKSAGLYAVFIDHNQNTDISDWEVKPDFIIHQLSDVLDLLKKLNQKK